MSRGLVPAVVLALGAVTPASAAPRAPAKPQPHVPLAPLAMLPSVGRVRIVVGRSEALVLEEVSLPRGEWRGDALDLWVAFGAPSAPRALDAQLVPVADGMLEASEDVRGEALSTTPAPRRPRTAHPLLGRDTMAGVVVHVGAQAFSRAVRPGGMAVLRIRSLVPLVGTADAERSVLVRLGASRGTPLTLGRITISAAPDAGPIAVASAHLCGPEADPTPLAVAIDGALAASRAGGAIAPVLAVRHASDDLCVTFRGAGG